MYVLERQGVYGQGVYGVFDTLGKAKKAAKLSAKNDKDDYHAWVVLKYRLNTITEGFEKKPVYVTRKEKEVSK